MDSNPGVPSSNSRTWLHTPSGFVSPGALPLTDRACRHGFALFETVRNTGSGLLHWDGHIALLKKSALQAGFPAALQAFADLEILISQLPDTNGLLRVYLTAGDGSPRDPVLSPRLFVIYEDSPQTTPSAPCRLHLSAAPFTPAPHGWKTASYWPNIRALQQAFADGLDESLLLNAQEELVSASMANVFLVKNNHLLTPTLESGARPGLIRKWVIEEFDVLETRLHRTELEAADEIFLTSSGIGIRPALYEKAVPGSVTAAVQDRFEYLLHR